MEVQVILLLLLTVTNSFALDIKYGVGSAAIVSEGSTSTTVTGLLLGNGSLVSAYTGASCTNAMLTAQDASGAWTCSSTPSIAGTLGSEQAPALTAGNWTVGAGWESPIVGPGLIKNADGTGTQTPSAATTIVAGTTYKVVITLSALSVGSASYTLGGTTGGSSLAAATTYTDYVYAATTGKLIITPTNTSRFTISAISVKPLSSGTLTIDGAVIFRNTLAVSGALSVNSLKLTGAATGKNVVCVDVTTGLLYASSTGTDCSN